jgi:tight adherence protein B
MMVWTILAALVCLLLLVAMARMILNVGGGSNMALRRGLRSMVAVQRSGDGGYPDTSAVDSPDRLEDEGEDGGKQQSVSSTRLTLQKRLKFAQLSEVPPFAFALGQIGVSIAAFLLARTIFEWVLQALSLTAGPLLINAFINFRMQARFKKFDRDYPQFLLSFVGMLKTGLNPMQALEAAALNLDGQSLVRQEVELMLERLRLGVSEERSIGSFGEDINHPEIELFVQSLLLSRRVGGNLSETIDRLARQVRKRQYFRASANAAVGLQRGSIIFILAILCALEGYLYLVWPECVTITWTNPKSKPVAQFCLGLILFGLYWVRQVTKIKV